MGRRSKYLFRDRAEAESAYNKAREHELRTLMAFGDILEGRCVWLERGAYRLALCRADSPCGGLAVLEFRHPGQRNSYTAYYLEDAYHELGPRRAALLTCPDAHDVAQLLALAMVERDRIINAPTQSRRRGGDQWTPTPT